MSKRAGELAIETMQFFASKSKVLTDRELMFACALLQAGFNNLSGEAADRILADHPKTKEAP